MRESPPGDCERILEIRGRKLPYFSRAAGELNLPRPIGDTGIFPSCQGPWSPGAPAGWWNTSDNLPGP